MVGRTSAEQKAGMTLFGKSLNGKGIFRRRHSGYFFKLPGKIVNGIIPQKVSNLSKIHVFFPNQFFRPGDFHPGKILDNAAAAFTAEQVLKL